MPNVKNIQLKQQQQTGQPVQILQNAEGALQQEQALQDERQNQALQEAEGQGLQAQQEAPGQEVREAQANETLVAEARQEAPAAQAVRTAEGTPVQEQEPAPSTWKERRAERKKAKAAQKACPVGTAAAYDMVEQLKERDKMSDRSMEPYLVQADAKGVDRRCLKAFCQGYRKNRFGSPATEEDKRKKQEDERFLEDYCSDYQTARERQLDRIVGEMIHTRFSPDMFTPYKLRHNLAELKTLGERLIYIQNLKAENEWYFKELQQKHPGTWEAFEAAGTLGASFVPLLMAHCEATGVDADAAGYLGSDKEGEIREARKDLGPLTENFQRALTEYQNRCAYGLEKSLQQVTSHMSRERLRQITMDPVERLRQADQAFERLKGDPRLGLTQEELASEAVAKAKKVLVPVDAEENIRTIRLMRELGQNGDQKPSADLYARARALAAPLVQRIMDYNVRDMLKIHNWMQLSHAGELEKLAGEAGLADDLLRLQQPVRGRLTLQDDLIGSGGNQYIYQSAMVKALAKRIRMLSLLARGHMEDGNVKEGYLTEKERREAGGDPELMIRQKLEEAEEEIGSAQKRYQDLGTLGARELDNMARNLKYEPAASESEKEETPGFQQAWHRMDF